MIAVIDYGIGNLHSVSKAFKYLGAETCISGDAEVIKSADALVLPGVGAFPDGYRALERAGLIDVICDECLKKPLLGICLGMQLLFEHGNELESCDGLGLIPGSVDRIDTELKLPQIGWNSLEIKKESRLLHGVPSGSYVYFVHSYCAHAKSVSDVSAVCDYGCEVLALAERGNVFGCQFHPEKSGDVGMKILDNFIQLV